MFGRGVSKLVGWFVVSLVIGELREIKVGTGCEGEKWRRIVGGREGMERYCGRN